MSKPESRSKSNFQNSEDRMQKLIKETFAALDQLSDLFNEIRNN